MSRELTIGVLTASDRASQGVYADESGAAIVAYLEAALTVPFAVDKRVVADEQAVIESALIAMIDVGGCSLVLTTGGTGPAPRDVTPEATAAVAERMMPGFGEAMRARSLQVVPTAILSRQTAATRGSCLIVNLPGRPASIRDCLEAVMPAIPYCVDLIGGARIETDPAVVTAFRPKGA